MSSDTGPRALHPLLIDPAWWKRRIEQMRGVPRQLLLTPRQDLARPGCEVTELRLRSHDGKPLVGVLSRCAFAREGLRTVVRLVAGDEAPEPHWALVEAGDADLVLLLPADHAERRLEDRVLDVVRLACAASTLEGIQAERVELAEPAPGPPRDELLIAARLMSDRLC